MDARILLIETLALHAWPPKELVPLDGWLLRTHPATSRRVNSVWPNAWHGAIPLAKKLEMVEGFYHDRGRPPRFQICPAARPLDLDEVLAARGYGVDAPTAVQIARAGDVLARRKPPPGIQVEVFDELKETWTAAYCRAQGAPESEVPARMKALGRIEQQVCYVQARMDGMAVSVARGVLEDGWLGIFGMSTQKDSRRHGAGTAVLLALAEAAVARGAHDLYLQVMENNAPALQMYAGVGFETLYGYHYRDRRSE